MQRESGHAAQKVILTRCAIHFIRHHLAALTRGEGPHEVLNSLVGGVMFKSMVFSVLLLWAPTISWAADCPGSSPWPLNQAVNYGSTEYIVLATLEASRSSSSAAEFSIQKEFKGSIPQKTILVTGAHHHYLSLEDQVIIFLHRATSETEEAKEFHFPHLSCGTYIYRVAKDDTGGLFIEGGLLTQDGGNTLPLSDFQTWVDNPEDPDRWARQKQMDTLLKDPLINCRLGDYGNMAYIKKAGERRATVWFTNHHTSTRIHKKNPQSRHMHNIVFHKNAWEGSDFGETSAEDKQKLEEWTKGVWLDSETFLEYIYSNDPRERANGFQRLTSRLVLFEGISFTISHYHHTLSLSRIDFIEQAMAGNIWYLNFAQREAFDFRNKEVRMPYTLPIFDGYELEVHTKLYCFIDAGDHML